MDELFKEIANGYIEQQGEELLRENIALTFKRRKQTRQLAFFGSAAAVLLVAVFTVSRFTMTVPPEQIASSPSAPAAEPATSAESTEIVLLSSRLPAGSELLNSKTDNGETICTIQNEYGNEIILSFKPVETGGMLETEQFTPVNVGGNPAFLLVRQDYKALTVEADGMLYKFTSAFEAGDLYELASAIL